MSYYVESGTMSTGIILERDYMGISSGGKHCGSLQIESGAVVSAYSGAIIDFTVADRTSADDYLINDLSRIYGAPTYTITVSDDQEAGTYKLAQGASAFNKTIFIYTTDTCFGSLTVNGEALTVDGGTYELNNVDGNLTLTITKTEYVIGNFDGMLEFTSDGSGTIYTPAGKQEIAGTLDPVKWEVVGAGDFNKSGTDSLLWIEKDTGYVYVQNDLTNFNEVNNKSNCLGILGEEYEILSTGDFTGTGIDGVIMQGPAFGDASVSLNYGLPIWGREADGTTFAGWLGALVNTQQLGANEEIAGIADLNNDGTDDILVLNTATDDYYGWLVKNGAITSSLAIA